MIGIKQNDYLQKKIFVYNKRMKLGTALLIIFFTTLLLVAGLLAMNFFLVMRLAAQ